MSDNERSDGLLPQAHGGALMPPWHKRDHRPTAPSRSSLKKINRHVHDILATNAPGLVQRMIDGALETDDIRAVAVIATKVLEHVQGRPTDKPQGFEGGDTSLDLSTLTPAERGHAMECIGHIKRYVALARERAAGIERPEG